MHDQDVFLLGGMHGRAVLPYKADPIKAESAAIFRAKWEEAKADPTYLRLRQRHREQYEVEANKATNVSTAPPGHS